jgi:hypothetical protein
MCLGFPKSDQESQVAITVEEIEAKDATPARPPELEQIGEAEEVTLDEDSTKTLAGGLVVAVRHCMDGEAQTSLSEMGVPAANRVSETLEVGDQLQLKSARRRKIWKATLVAGNSSSATLSIETYGIS